MNERIKELAKESGLVRCGDWGMERWEGPRYDSVGDQDLEKFAQLIVEECMNKISGLVIPETFEQDIEPYEKWNQALGHAALEIEQHFYGDTPE